MIMNTYEVTARSGTYEAMGETRGQAAARVRDEIGEFVLSTQEMV